MLRFLTRSLLFCIIFVVITTTALGIYIYEEYQRYSDRILPGVYVNDKPLDYASREDVEKKFQPQNDSLQKVSFSIRYQDSIATFSGSTINLRYDTKAISDHALLIGRSSYLPSRIFQVLTAILHLHTYSFTYYPTYNLEAVNLYLRELNDTYSIPAEDALFEFKNNRVIGFKVEKPGVQITTDSTIQALKKHIEKNTPIDKDKVFIVESEPLKPKISIGDINDFGIEEKIGEGVSDFTGSSPERQYNLTLASKKIHGILIPPGEIFSYNKAIGDISQATGFKPGYIIKEGRTVLGDGGGVCQDSTTLFRAALNTGLPIVERQAHAYRVKYYENDRKPGFDATVFAPSVDFKFKNDTSAHILIQASVKPSEKILTFEFYGKKDDRKIELSEAKVYDIRPAPEPLYQDDPTLPRGTQKQVDWAAGGAKSSFTYKVTLPDGTVSQDRTFYSTYRPWRAVFLVGTQ